MATQTVNGKRGGGSASRAAREWLIERIRRGEYRPGGQIPTEMQLCELLGVGRSTVREAIHSLVAADVLEIRRGQGTYVRAVSPEDRLEAVELPPLLSPQGVLEVIEFREILETGVVALACARATAEDLAAMQRALAANAQATREGGSATEAVDSDEQFHRALAEAAHNPVVLQTVDSLNGLFRHSRETTSRIPGANERAYRSHRDILEAVVARAADRAQHAMLRHLDVLRQEVVRQARELVAAAERQRRRRVAARTRPLVSPAAQEPEASDLRLP